MFCNHKNEMGERKKNCVHIYPYCSINTDWALVATVAVLAMIIVIVIAAAGVPTGNNLACVG